MHRFVVFQICCFLVCLPTAPAEELTDVYRQVKSSVVVIETEGKALDADYGVGLVDVGALGSGVLVSADGKVMTAAHVVQTADRISVTFMSGEKIRARVLASEPAADLALLQLERRPSVDHVAALADSDTTEVGEQVFVVGAPMGMSHTLTVGHISARRRDDETFSSMLPTELFQTDAAINQGNSGGPMFNMQGEVCGIVSYIISQGGGFEGLGFVITSNMARRLLLDEPSMWSGMQGLLLADELARILNVPQSRGMLVQAVAERSLAEHIGLRGGAILAEIVGNKIVLGGDIILDVMGISLDEEDGAHRIRERVNALKDGDEVAVKVLRGGEVIELSNYYFLDLLRPAAPDRPDRPDNEEE